MSLNAVIPFVDPRAQAENSRRRAPKKERKRDTRNRRRRAKSMDSGPIRSLVPTPVPSIIYPEIPSLVPSPFDTPEHSPRGGSPAPDFEVNPKIPDEPNAAELPVEEAEEPPAALIIDAPVYQDVSLESSSLSSESTRTRTPSVGSTSSSSSSSAHSRSIHSNASNKSHASARPGRPRSVATQNARLHRRRSKSSPNGWYRVTAMEEARKKGRPVKYGVTRDLRVAFMREGGTVSVGKRPAFGCCVIQ